MKRDMDIIRNILLIMSNAPGKLKSEDIVLGNPDADAKAVHYNINQAHQGGLITGDVVHSMSGDAWYNLELAWKGNEFLDVVQDDDVWAETKKGMQKVKGFTFDLAKDMAKGLIKKQIEELTGVKI